MKKILTKVKLQIPAGQANPAPPIGPALAQHGINISDFCQKFNDATKDKAGFKIPVIITIYEDRTFDFELKQPLASDLIKKAAGIENRKKVGKLTKKQIKEIAQMKLPDLNTNDIEKAMKIIEAQAKGMGIEVE